MKSIEFAVPGNMSPEMIARTFYVYLKGQRAFFECEEKNDGHPSNGPYRQKKGSDLDWNLDEIDNYELHIHSTQSSTISKASITCNNELSQYVLDAMVVLFESCYLLPRKWRKRPT